MRNDMIGGFRMATAAMIAASLASAADAQPRRYGGGWGGHGYGGRGGWGHYHRGGGDGVLGAIVGGLVVGGLIAAISGAGNRDGGRDGEGGDRAGDSPRPGEDAAVDQCAANVERETAGTVDTIDTVDRFADGWRVRGTVETGRQNGDRQNGDRQDADRRDADRRDASRAATGAYRGRDSFSCSIVNGRIDDVRFGSDADRAPERAPAR